MTVQEKRDELNVFLNRLVREEFNTVFLVDTSTVPDEIRVDLHESSLFHSKDIPISNQEPPMIAFILYDYNQNPGVVPSKIACQQLLTERKLGNFFYNLKHAFYEGVRGCEAVIGESKIHHIIRCFRIARRMVGLYFMQNNIHTPEDYDIYILILSCYVDITILYSYKLIVDRRYDLPIIEFITYIAFLSSELLNTTLTYIPGSTENNHEFQSLNKDLLNNVIVNHIYGVSSTNAYLFLWYFNRGRVLFHHSVIIYSELIRSRIVFLSCPRYVIQKSCHFIFHVEEGREVVECLGIWNMDKDRQTHEEYKELLKVEEEERLSFLNTYTGRQLGAPLQQVNLTQGSVKKISIFQWMTTSC